MLPRQLWFTILALLLAIGLPAAALAGGWSTVTLDSQPGDLVAGGDTTVGFTVLQHGQTPVVDQLPKVIFTNTATGESTFVVAQAEGKPGHYVARFALQQPGTWDWQIDVYEGPHPMPALTVVAAAAPVPATPLGQAVDVEWLAIAGGAALLAVAFGLALVSGLRRRGTPRPVAR